jgi:rSAM/selenodomain-associated transferase 1
MSEDTGERATAVLVFARAPVAGQAKTRLIPLLGAQGAADLSAQLTRRALRVALDARIGPVELWCAPDGSHPFLTGSARDFGVTLHAQSAGDIGARMAHAFEHALVRHGRVVLIGADAVSLQPADLQAAAGALRRHDCAFAPAADGGYLLVALQTLQPALFEDIAWGGEQVWSQTQARIAVLGLDCHMLATGYDLDRPDDYRRALRDGLIGAPP